MSYGVKSDHEKFIIGELRKLLELKLVEICLLSERNIQLKLLEDQFEFTYYYTVGTYNYPYIQVIIEPDGYGEFKYGFRDYISHETFVFNELHEFKRFLISKHIE